MPRKPHKTVMKKASEAWMREYLLHGYYTTGKGEKSRIGIFMYGVTLPDWSEIRDALLPDWIKNHPCTRPFAWWTDDAPEPRRRVGGTGRRLRNAILEWGIPHDEWFKDVDPDNPPIYESQAAYLQRLGLLTEGEIKWLADHHELLEPEAIKYRQDIGPDVYPMYYQGPGYYEDSTNI